MKELRQNLGIEVVRIGQRLVRDDRVTTHVALVSRAFGAEKIFMTEVNPEIKDTVNKINENWGGNFTIEFIDKWRNIVKKKKNEGFAIVHLTMYGQNINDIQNRTSRGRKHTCCCGSRKSSTRNL